MADEEIYENSCEDCAKKEIQCVSTVHCFECDTRMCTTCKNKHSRSRAKKKHHLIRIDDAPPDVELSFLKRTCSSHSGEEIRFQCTPHDVPLCGMCAKTHYGCEILTLADAKKKIKDEDSAKTTLNACDSLSERTIKSIETTDKHRESTDMTKETLQCNIDQLREFMNKKLDDFLMEPERKLKGTLEKKSRNRKELVAKEYIIRKHKELMILAMESGDDTRTYLCEQVMKKISDELELILQETDTEPEMPNFQSLKRRLSEAFIPVKERKHDQRHSDEPSTSSDVEAIGVPNHRKPILQQTLAVDDKIVFNDCTLDDKIVFNDCTWMNEEHIVLTDSTSKKLYSYFIYQNKLEELLTLPTMPWCVETIDTDLVAVSFHAERMIQFYRIVPGEATDVEKMYVFNMCMQLQYIPEESTLYVLYKSLCGYRSAEIGKLALYPTKMNTFDPNDEYHNGKKLGILELDEEATAKLAESTSYKITRDRKHLILTCSYTHEVCFIDISQGRTIFKYDPVLANPVFVETDNNGFVYVVWSTNSTIHMLSPNGEFIREILNGQDGLALPSRMYFNKGCDKFIVIDQFRRKQVKIYSH